MKALTRHGGPELEYGDRPAPEVGSGAVAFDVGGCPACLRGEENLCESRGLLGLDRQGVFDADFDAALRTLSAHPPALGWLTVLPLSEGAEALKALPAVPA